VGLPEREVARAIHLPFKRDKKKGQYMPGKKLPRKVSWTESRRLERDELSWWRFYSSRENINRFLRGNGKGTFMRGPSRQRMRGTAPQE